MALTGSLQCIVAQECISSPAPAAKFHWEATNTYLPSRQRLLNDSCGSGSRCLPGDEGADGKSRSHLVPLLSPLALKNRPSGRALGEEGSTSNTLAFG